MHNIAYMALALNLHQKQTGFSLSPNLLLGLHNCSIKELKLQFQQLNFGLHWVMPRRVIELFACWQGNFGRHQHINIWRAIPHCLMWCVWKERNARTFEGCEQIVAELKLLFLRMLFDWTSATRLCRSSTLLDFIDSLCF